MKQFVYENAIKKVYPIIHSMLFHEVPVFQNEKYSLDDLLKDSSLADFEQLYKFATECLEEGLIIDNGNIVIFDIYSFDIKR